MLAHDGSCQYRPAERLPVWHTDGTFKETPEAGRDRRWWGFRLLKMCLLFSVHMQKASSVKTSICVHVQGILISYCVIDKFRMFS